MALSDDIFESDTIRICDSKGVFQRDSVTNKIQTFKNQDNQIELTGQR